MAYPVPAKAFLQPSSDTAMLLNPSAHPPTFPLSDAFCSRRTHLPRTLAEVTLEDESFTVQICASSTPNQHCIHIGYTVHCTGSKQKQQTSNSSSADVRWDSMGLNCSIDFLPDAKHLIMVDRSAYTDGTMYNHSVQACSSAQKAQSSLLSR